MGTPELPHQLTADEINDIRRAEALRGDGPIQSTKNVGLPGESFERDGSEVQHGVGPNPDEEVPS